MRAPARTLIVNAASVQAAKSVPRRPDICGQRAALAELEHRLVVPENMTLTRAAPGGHDPGEKREPWHAIWTLCLLDAI
jgi:hypothetical protein